MRIYDELKQKRWEVNQLLRGINELQIYLHSSKFHEDTTVQVSDVLRRLEQTIGNYCSYDHYVQENYPNH